MFKYKNKEIINYNIGYDVRYYVFPETWNKTVKLINLKKSKKNEIIDYIIKKIVIKI